MKKFKRRSFGSSSKLEQQHHEEAPILDLSKDIGENMRELLTEITKKENMSTSKRMGYLNNFSQFVRSVPPTADFGLTLDEVTACLRIALLNPAKEVRAAGFRAFRHLLSDEQSLNTFLQQRIDIFISKCLDLPPSAEVERVQALRLVRKMVYLCPHIFPMSLAMSLSAVSCDASQDKDRMSRACLATLCELAVHNTKIAAYSGVVGAIVINTLDCSVPRMNESLVCTILYLLNHPKQRSFVRKKVGLEAILAPFTDLYYTHYSDMPESLIKEDRRTRIHNAKLALITIVRSWSGLISLCDPEENNIESVLGVFQLPNTDIRRAIIDTFFEIFCLCPPKITSDFNEALHSVDPSAMQEMWKISEEFVLAEGNAVLAHGAQATRTNLTESHLSLVLHAFIEAGILESLVQVITTSDDVICIRGSILLGELLHMANMLLPPSYSGNSHCLPSLMALATNLEKTPEERGKASAAVGYLDQVHQLKKRGILPNTLFMEQLLAQASNDGSQSKSKPRQEKVDVPSAWRDMDEVLSAIRETQVMLTQEQDFQTWNWDLVSTILESSKMSLKRPDEPIFFRFIKRLILFYKPFQRLYSEVNQTNVMSRKYSAVALQLTDFLLRKEEQPDGERLLIEILQDIRDGLGEATQPGILTGIFSGQSLNETLSRDYFLIIGRLSSSTNGLRILEKTPGIFQYLMEICSMTSRDSLVKLIISSFDYGRDGIARVLLSKALSSAPATSRLYATKFLRVLLRAKSPYFSNWGIEFLTNQLYDQDSEIVESAIDILEEACENEANLQRLIEVKPALLHLGEHGIRLLSRYVSVARGFSYLQEMDYLNPLVEAWKSTYSREYVNWIELEIAESLSLYERHGTDGGYIRRSSSNFIQRKDVFILPHLYGELARHRHGIQLIQEQKLLSDAENIVRQQYLETSHDIFQVKAALWAIGHITSTVLGIGLVLSSKSTKSRLSIPIGSFSEPVNDSFEKSAEEQEEEQAVGEEEEEEEDTVNIIEVIVDMALNCEVLTLRGTCFYILGLITSTSIGADLLDELGWESVRHKSSDIWPVIEQDVTYIYETDSEEDPDSEAPDEDEVLTLEPPPNPSQERFGGIYVGSDDEDGPDETDVGLSFNYEVYMFHGDEKRKKKAKVPTSDESRYLQMMSSVNEDEPERSSMKMTFYDVDSYGKKYENKHMSLITGLERMNPSYSTFNAGSIYMGDDSSVAFSEYRPPDYSAGGSGQLSSWEESMPFLSGKSKSSPLVSAEESKKKRSMKKKEIYDEYGIYLGEEEIEDDEEQADTIEANLSEIIPSPASPSCPPENESRNDLTRTLSTDATIPLKPIREEKSQESLNSRSCLIDLSVQEEIEVELKEKGNIANADSSNDTSTLNSSITSDDRTPTRTGIRLNYDKMDHGRFRSVSLNDGVYKNDLIPTSPRSSSFSGTAMHNKLMIAGPSQLRSGSDPGFGIIPNSLGSSLSSQECELLRNENGTGPRRSGKKYEGRKKSRSETEDDRIRSNSIISDRHRIAKRLRGVSTLSLGISPKSARGLSSVTASESPYSSSYSREGSYGFTAWQTLKKQRSFKKEIDSNLRRQCGAVADRRKYKNNRGYRYRRMSDNPSRRGSSVTIPHVSSRRHASAAVSGGGTTEVLMTEMYSGGATDVYVGRCLPTNLPEFFSMTTYQYDGSWADNFVEFSETHNLRTFDKNYKHVKERCLACKIRLKKDGRSESDTSLPPKSRSSSKDDRDALDTDDDSESSERDEKSSKQKINVFKEVLRLVINLSSAVASKGTQQEILSLRARFPWAFQDLCLYSQVMEQLGMFTFRLTIRRFIQALFEGVNYSLIFETADLILGRTSPNEKES